MPIVEIHLLEGYSPDEKKRLGEAVTDAIRFIVPARPEAIVVMLREMKPDQYFRGGITREPAPARFDPKKRVLDFLEAMQMRELAKAKSMLADNFTMQFPGTQLLTDLQELIEWAALRYRFVEKTYEDFDAMQSTGEASIVYCRGTLSGEWPDGTPFDNIRFIDRFEIVGNMISKQDVWNDIAETKANA